MPGRTGLSTIGSRVWSFDCGSDGDAEIIAQRPVLVSEAVADDFSVAVDLMDILRHFARGSLREAKRYWAEALGSRQPAPNQVIVAHVGSAVTAALDSPFGARPSRL